MPFTFSHPAAVLPAKFLPEKWVSMTALIIGSCTPDFEYFIRMRNISLYSHSWSGIFYYDLPLGFALTFIYHYLIRDGFIDNLPPFLRNRLTQFKSLNWGDFVKKHFIVLFISLLIGITTHVVWDGFTHRTGYFVGIIPWLRKLVLVGGVGHYRYYLLQVASSVLGGLLVAISIFRIKAATPTPRRNIFIYWTIASAIALIITTLRVTLGTVDMKSAIPIDVVVTAMSAGMIGMVITPLLLKLTRP